MEKREKSSIPFIVVALVFFACLGLSTVGTNYRIPGIDINPTTAAISGYKPGSIQQLPLPIKECGIYIRCTPTPTESGLSNRIRQNKSYDTTFRDLTCAHPDPGKGVLSALRKIDPQYRGPVTIFESCDSKLGKSYGGIEEIIKKNPIVHPNDCVCIENK